MDRPVDELVERILGACADDARERAAQIISQARREAEEEVKSLIKSAMKAALLREAAAALDGAAGNFDEPAGEVEAPAEPHTIDTAVGWYVYGITRSSASLPHDLRGVTEQELEVVEHQGIAAVVNRVPLEEFESALRHEPAENLQWLEATARAHDGVLKSLLSAAPVLPFRFCTILRSDGDVRALLARHHGAIARTLDQLDGKREWGVRITFDAAHIAPPAAQDDGKPGGKSYLLNRKRRRDERGEATRAARETAIECHQQLAALAADAVTLPARRSKAFSEPRELLVNAAYLVADADAARFRALVDSLNQRHRDAALMLEMTGPWPAYNFARLDLSVEAAA